MLNVSISTVSRALQNNAHISPATTARVQDAAREFGYEPNQTAQFLKSGKTLTLGVILPHLTEAFFSESISGIEDCASDHNYNLLMGQSHDDMNREKKIVESMKKHRVDGLLVSIAKSTTDYSHFEMLKRYDIPIVFFDRVPEYPDAHTVTCRLEAGMLEAITFLVGLKHDRIALINGPEDLLATHERMAGYRSSLSTLGIAFNPSYIVHSDLSKASTFRAMADLLEARPAPTAVVAFNDYVALDAIQYARKMNIRINRDLSFVSFANLPLCNYMEDSPLASVEQFPYRQGQCATEMLLEILANARPANLTDSFRKVVLEPQLFIHQ